LQNKQRNNFNFLSQYVQSVHFTSLHLSAIFRQRFVSFSAEGDLDRRIVELTASKGLIPVAEVFQDWNCDALTCDRF
jgi:hypothetical protein